MPKACPYVMTQFVCPSIVADINHRKPKQTKRTVPLVCFGLFALSDNLISEVWFFAEGERFYSFGVASDFVSGQCLGCGVVVLCVGLK